MTKQQKVDQIKKLVSLIESKTGKKVKFEEKKITSKQKTLQEIKRAVSLIQQQTGKKVVFKEASGEAEGNKIVSNLQRLVQTASQINENLLEVKVTNKSSSISLKDAQFLMRKLINDINILIQEETAHSDDSEEGYYKQNDLDEDVKMTMDQITKNPQDIQKLNDKKIDIDLYDPNDPNNSKKINSNISSII